MNMFEKLSLKGKLGIGFAIPITLFIVISVIASQSLSHLLTSQKWVNHTHEVIEHGDEIMAELVNMETGLRGYLITGQEEFLEPYYSGREHFDKLTDETKELVSDNPQQVSRISNLVNLKYTWIREHVEPSMDIRKDVNAGNATNADIVAYIGKGLGKKSMDTMRDVIADFIGEEKKLIVVRNQEQADTASATTAIIYIGSTIAILFGIIAAFFIIRNLTQTIGGEPSYATAVISRIADGQLDEEVETKEGDTTSLLAAMKDMRQKLRDRAAEDKRMIAETSRIKTALDSVTANVMMADADRNIVYANDAVIDTLRAAADDIRKDLPNFNPETLMGGSIDQFHKNPQHQVQMLERMTGTTRTKIVVGGRHMSLIVNPVHDEDGNRIGTVVEWDDKTAEVRIQEEMDNIIAAANDGDLSERINLSDKDGFFKQLSEGLNTLLDKTSSFVHDMGQMFEHMSEGDLTNTISNDYRGEFDNIKTNANNTVNKLNEVLLKIQNAAGAVRSLASEVAQGSDDLSRRTESQASSLEETASSMEEMTSTVKQSSENASEANTLAAEAKSKAQSGGAVVDDAVNAMSEILESSNKINDIIGVIDEIAFQTNLLALNAAVEAARAGEQGRGFAVVAGEVRTLSQRSAAAAKEIKDLIRDSVSKVESGSTLVNQSGETLAEIVSAVDKVATMINDVNNAAIEQNAGISQINQAITQMDEMTQQNAALVEETSAASRSMSEESNNMASMISFFNLQGGMAMSAMPTVTAAPAPSPSPAPVMTYESPRSNNSSGGGAASFSGQDDWEDF